MKRVNFDYSRMRKVKEEYYNGSLSQEELNDYGWEPFLLNVKTKQGIEKYIESDTELIRLLEKKCIMMKQLPYVNLYYKNLEVELSS
jgi:hypothetical protein